ncbi:hypothetical protein DMUE_4115 [Dictyocoela muelleri]|nr:hypothetical protein DMUE_4115 [Dictyocoela muelleri]
MLRNFSEIISGPPTKIFDRSLTTRIIPEDWKTSNITTIFKKGCRHEPGNYRPREKPPHQGNPTRIHGVKDLRILRIQRIFRDNGMLTKLQIYQTTDDPYQVFVSVRCSKDNICYLYECYINL